MTFDTSGEYRIVRKSDGLYIVGKGLLFAIDSREEGEKFILSQDVKSRR